MHRSDGSLSFQTLVIASISSAAAALLTSLFWESGTVFSAAFTPVIVSIVAEALRKPASTISQVRSARREGAPSARAATGGGASAPGATATAAPPAPTVRRADGGGGAPVVKRFGGRRVNLRLALITAALAFVVAAAFLTLPELIVGQSIAGQPGRTTLGGGSSVDTSGEQTEPAETEGGDPAAGESPDPGADPEAPAGSEDPAPDPEVRGSGAPEDQSSPPPSSESQPQQQRSAPEAGSRAPGEPEPGRPPEAQQP